MAPLKRLLAAGVTALAVSVSLSAPVAAAAADPDAAGSAAGYLVTNLVDGNHLISDFGNESITADAVLALVAADRDEDAAAIDAMVGYLEQQAPSYATSPEAAAKLVIVALATGKDPAGFGGTDLVSLVKAGVQPDGSFGAFPGPYASGLGLIALARTGSEIPAAMTDWLVGRADPAGGWGYEPGQPADPDSTGMAILGLKALPQPTEATTAAIDAAVTWAGSARQADGSWAGFAPVNSTAVLGSALQEAGVEQAEAVAYLVGVQQPDGGLPTGAEGGAASDPLATTQAGLLLAGTSYLSPVPETTEPGWDATNIALWGLIAALGIGVAIAMVVRRR